jgi:YgiT-type zinc finger domain-containing protein
MEQSPDSFTETDKSAIVSVEDKMKDRGKRNMICVWCEQEGAWETTKDCTWIDPTGRHTVVVEGVPAIACPSCDDVYLTDDMNEKVEMELSGADLEALGERFTYEELLAAPKVSIFDLYKRDVQNEQNGCAR